MAPKYFEALTDDELKQFGAAFENTIFEPSVKPIHDDMNALKDNYRRLREHHIEETKWLWAELEKLRPGIAAKLKRPT